MALFTCTRCGKCCISFGRHIRIERSLSPVQYYCRVAVNGELLPVSIQPELRELFSSGDQDPAWCPFLRKDAAGLFTCTIYQTRPRICRDFKCRTMIIYDQSGREAGYVKGRRTLVSGDGCLETVWHEIPSGADDSSLKEILRKHRYRAESLD
ncbi:MAG TPA: YkgJ family cysteine cluster protein [Methanoregulaceae archaeon]|nr:YkgJ family cysteine cluster protein [Methanoregulaceae archaeon]